MLTFIISPQFLTKHVYFNTELYQNFIKTQLLFTG